MLPNFDINDSLRRYTWEKRKREIGQQASGKNWVEEEKRQLRESSGFGFD
jgi:hypothetical protein